MKKWGKFVKFLAAYVALILLYAGVCSILKPLVFFDFFKISQSDAAIPSLLGGFIPQGVSANHGKRYICGYMDNKSRSRLFVCEGSSKKEILLNNADGSPYTGHAGGVTVADDFIYIANAAKLFVLSTNAVDAAKDGGEIKFDGSVDVPCRASFCSNDGESLFVGEFHDDGYGTDESHKVQTADGEFQAIVFAYRLDENSAFGIEKAPYAAFAVADRAQGFAKNNNVAALSVSRGFSQSKIVFYDTSGEPDGEFELNNAKIPLFKLDSKRQTRQISAPHMSEDLEFENGDLLICFEASARKFGAGLLPFSLSHIMKMSTIV